MIRDNLLFLRASLLGIPNAFHLFNQNTDRFGACIRLILEDGVTALTADKKYVDAVSPDLAQRDLPINQNYCMHLYCLPPTLSRIAWPQTVMIASLPNFLLTGRLSSIHQMKSVYNNARKQHYLVWCFCVELLPKPFATFNAPIMRPRIECLFDFHNIPSDDWNVLRAYII